MTLLDKQPSTVELPAAPVTAGPRRARWRGGGSLSLRVGAALLGLYLGAAAVSAVWTPFDPREVGAGEPYSPPGGSHWFGTDRLGTDVFSQALAATRLDLGITVAAVALALVVGAFLGTIAGYYRGVADSVIMRSLEVLQAFPTLLLAMLIVQAVGPGTWNVIAVLAFVGLPEYLRLARAEILSKRTWQFADAARLAGCRPWRVAFGHLLPNSTGPLLAYTSINAAWVVLVTSSLGFLGVGIRPGEPEWGSMISRGQSGITSGEWWISLFPGLAVLGLAAAFYLLGDGLTDATDPRRRR
ncbi:ABC transporter permease [Phytohabitans kaempferiae]|uniref:ABC transporter permease n=1 Tax=Phytohabitans kaempferiae TaxID=1620943 RepID=A0ABV6MH87_9ACTN